ncbi:MAG TPA: hypothetical protein VK659_13570, partial [Asanoa sp.]|nr:hypothetical protein [Asanoa sp.]
WLLAADDEFWSLLLHCLFDKGGFARRHTDRLTRLPAVASGALVRTLPPGVTEAGLDELVRTGRWDALVAAAPATRRAWWRADPVGVAAAVIRARGLRLVERPLQAPSRRGAAVALVGPDGCGKSTVAARVAGTFPLPVRCVYMGLWADGELDGLLRHAARVVRRPFTAWRRYATGLRHRALGRLVIFDRYTYDALLSPRGSWRRLKRLYFLALSRSCPRPDLVILLDAPGRVMHARSGEYDAAHLERERREYAAVAERLPDVVRVNADRPVDAVVAEVTGHIWTHYRARSSR